MTTNIDRLWEPARVAASITDGALHATLDDHLRSELAATDAIPERVVCALTDPKPLDICMPVLNAVLAAQYHPLWQVIAGTTTISGPMNGMKLRMNASRHPRHQHGRKRRKQSSKRA